MVQRKDKVNIVHTIEERNIFFPALLFGVTTSQPDFSPLHQVFMNCQSRCPLLLHDVNDPSSRILVENLWGDWVKHRKTMGDELSDGHPLRSLHISLCWLGPCQSPWSSAGDSKNGHRFFLSLPMLSGHPIPHQLWVTEWKHVIYFTQGQIHHKQRLEKCFCAGVCPFWLYLEPWDHHTSGPKGDEWTGVREARLPSQSGN